MVKTSYAARCGIVFLIYFLILLSFLLPLAGLFHSRIVSQDSVDLNGTLWYQWFAKKCFQEFDFPSLYHTDFVGYPSGKNLLFDLGPALVPILSIPFQMLLGTPAYYNLFIVVLMALGGLACFILLGYIYKDALAAFIGGLFFAINPYVAYQVNCGRPEQAAMFWMPLFILFLLKMKDEKRKSSVLIAALLLVFASLSYWYYGMFLAMITVLFLIYSLLADKEDSSAMVKNTLLLLCLFSACMLILFFYPVFIQGARPCGYKTPGPFPAYAAIAGSSTPPYYTYMLSYTSGEHLPHAFLIITAALVILSIFNMKAYKNNPFFIVTAIFFFLLSLGPYQMVNGRPMALPYIWLYYIIPFFSRLWWPVNCFSAVLVSASIFLAGLICRIRSKNNPVAKTIFPAMLVIAYLFPFYNAQYNIIGHVPWLKMQAFALSEFKSPHEVYYYLKQQDGFILELPFTQDMGFLRNQPIHGKRVFESQGYTIKGIIWPKEQLKYLRLNPLLAHLDLLCSSDAPAGLLPEQALKAGLRQLYASGFRFIVVNPDYLEKYRTKDWLYAELKRIFQKPYREYADGTLLYRIEEPASETSFSYR